MAEPRLSIYEKKELPGPVTKKHKRKLWAMYAVWALIGFLPVIFQMSWRWQVAGLGWAVPGGGFLALGGVSGILLFVLSILIMLVAVFEWQQTGYQVIPFIVWAVLLVLPITAFFRDPKWGAMTGTWLCLGAIALYIVLTRIHNHNMQKRALKKQAERVEYFKEEIPAEEAAALPEVADGDFELTERQLRQQKFMLDLANGPFGEFQGFDKPTGSQIPLSSLRYQINQMMNAIQQIQCQYTPNFRGYSADVQRRFIDLYRHPKVWEYWKMENLLGNFSTKNDPIGKDNVMMTGFFLVNVTMYMRNNGDMRYEEPGSLTFKNDKEEYPHDVHNIADAIVWNWNDRDYVMYPCEPNFNFALCNWKAIQSMVSYENIFHNGKWTENADRVYNAYVQEMMSPSGASYLIKSTRMGCGIALPLPTSEGFQIPMYNTVDPVLSRQTFAFYRKDSYERDENGDLRFKAIPFDHATSAKNYVDSVALCLFPCKEMGDAEAAAATMKVHDEKCEWVEENGTIHYKSSVEANALLLQASINTRNGWRRAVVDGPAECTKNGPLLEEASYPDVMVAKAFSHGDDLEMVLYPFDEAGGTGELKLRLTPGAAYTVKETGEQFTADAEGMAALTVALAGRTPVTVVPA